MLKFVYVTAVKSSTDAESMKCSVTASNQSFDFSLNVKLQVA